LPFLFRKRFSSALHFPALAHIQGKRLVQTGEGDRCVLAVGQGVVVSWLLCAPGGRHRAAPALADPALHPQGSSLPCSSCIPCARLSERSAGQGETTVGRAFHT